MVNQGVKHSIYRIALPSSANSEQKRNFQRKIAAIRQVNPDWAVVSDWAKPGEKEAFMILRKDKDYAYRRAAYQATSALSRVLLGGYGVKS